MIINALLLGFLYKSGIIKLVLAWLFLLALGAVYFTRGFATRYLTCTLNTLVKTILLIFQLIVSAVAAAILPNNYLNETTFFQELYESGGMWIPITMILSFILVFMIVGIFFSLILSLFFPQEKKEDEPLA